MAIAGIISTALMAVNLVSDQQAVSDKQQELSEEGQQLVELNGLSLSLTALLNAYQDPQFTVTPWADLGDAGVESGIGRRSDHGGGQ